jgi:glyoxylase-like metal-dependent hydrolase (beta-lactamase superfamily II)
MLQANVVPGVHRIEDAYTNWYVLEEGTRLTIVDAGVPTSWRSLLDALQTLGRSTSDIEALVLTHAHFDHVGFAERARQEFRIPVWVHELEVPLTRHPWRYEHESPRSKYLLTRPKALPIVATLIRNRAFFPKPIRHVRTFGSDAGTLDVPGSPRVVFTPGHTYGHCSLHLPDRGAVIAGDALVMLNLYTGERGPQIVARAATADSAQNLASLDALAATGAGTVLTGHGEPWREGAEAAAAAARRVGVT